MQASPYYFVFVATGGRLTNFVYFPLFNHEFEYHLLNQIENAALVVFFIEFIIS